MSQIERLNLQTLRSATACAAAVGTLILSPNAVQADGLNQEPVAPAPTAGLLEEDCAKRATEGVDANTQKSTTPFFYGYSINLPRTAKVNINTGTLPDLDGCEENAKYQAVAQVKHAGQAKFRAAGKRVIKFTDDSEKISPTVRLKSKVRIGDKHRIKFTAQYGDTTATYFSPVSKTTKR